MIAYEDLESSTSQEVFDKVEYVAGEAPICQLPKNAWSPCAIIGFRQIESCNLNVVVVVEGVV